MCNIVTKWEYLIYFVLFYDMNILKNYHKFITNDIDRQLIIQDIKTNYIIILILQENNILFKMFL